MRFIFAYFFFYQCKNSTFSNTSQTFTQFFSFFRVIGVFLGKKRVLLGLFSISFTIAYPHERKADYNPYHLAHSGDKTGIYAIGPADREGADGKGKASFTGTKLHRREEKNVAKKRSESHNQHTVEEIDVAGKDAQDEVNLQSSKHSCRELEDKGSVKANTVLGVELSYLLVNLHKLLLFLLGESAGILTQPRYAAYNTECLYYHAVLIALDKKINSKKAEGSHSD
jgi:hypothetical protein